jgi:GH24 family phage-related lysozyme (muramidase)
VSSKLIEAIKGNEGKMLKAYIAPEGFDKDGKRNGKGLTVGYGHLVKPGEDTKKGDTITETKADELLNSDAEGMAKGVRTALGTTQVSQREFDALVDMAFGLGSIGTSNTPKLMKALGGGDYDAASKELRTDTATNGLVLPGLQNRSTQRENMFRDWKYDKVSIYPKKK